MTMIDDLYRYMGLEPSGLCAEDIGQINLGLDAILSQLRLYTGRYLSRATWIDTFNASGMTISSHSSNRQRIILGEYPIVSVASVIVDGNTLVANVDYKIDKASGMLYRIYQSTQFEWWIWDGIRTQQMFPMVTVQYTAGYDPLPADLMMVIVDFVTDRLRIYRRDSLGSGGNILAGDFRSILIEGVGRVTTADRGAGLLSGNASSVAAGGPVFQGSYPIIDSYKDFQKFVKPERHFMFSDQVVSP